MILELLFVAVAVVPTDTPAWPQIVGIEKEYQFNDPNEARVEVYIRDQKGESQYRLECGSYRYDGNPDIYFSGDFECSLESLYSTESVSTLFAYDKDHSRDWENRALFFAEHFVGICRCSLHGGMPRILKLRNMEIVLEIYDEQLVFEELEGRKSASFLSFRFRVKVSRDDGAIRSITDDIGFDDLPIWYHRPGMCLTDLDIRLVVFQGQSCHQPDRTRLDVGDNVSGQVR